MNILFIADVPVADPVSGSEQVLFQQTRGLAAKGHHIYAITRQEDGPSSQIRKVGPVTEAVYRADPNSAFAFSRALRKYPVAFFREFSAQADFRKIVCHQPFNCLPLLASGRIKGIPLVYVFHSPGHEEYLLMHEQGSALKKYIPALGRRVVERFCLRRAARVMVLSDFMKHKAMELHRIPEARFVVNPGGVDLERFSPPPDREVLKKDLGMPGGKIHLLTIRNLEPRMGIENLVTALHTLNKEGAAFHLVLGGEGFARRNIERLIRELGLSDDITMTGFIPAERLAHYYGAADYFIMPTRELEGFGLVTPESLACGTPVLGTPIGGTREILAKFDKGFLFTDATPAAMAAGIKRAAEDFPAGVPQYEELRRRCRQFAEEHYSWQRHIDRLASLL